MHGAQDGQKFIGILFLFFGLVNGTGVQQVINPMENVGIIIYTAVIMAMGVSIGGKKIVDNIGKEMVELDNKHALMSDVSTVIALFLASMIGVPVSTTHAKTISIIAVGKNSKRRVDQSKVYSICRAWIWNFPICGLIGFCLAKMLEHVI